MKYTAEEVRAVTWAEGAQARATRRSMLEAYAADLEAREGQEPGAGLEAGDCAMAQPSGSNELLCGTAAISEE